MINTQNPLFFKGEGTAKEKQRSKGEGTAKMLIIAIIASVVVCTILIIVTNLKKNTKTRNSKVIIDNFIIS